MDYPRLSSRWQIFSFLALWVFAGAAPAQVQKPTTANAPESSEQIITVESRLQSLQSIDQSIASFSDEGISALSLAELADAAWKEYPTFARTVFDQSLNRIGFRQNDDAKEIERKHAVARKVITLIARHDKNWSQLLFDSLYADAAKRSRAKLASAWDIAESDPSTAKDLATDAIKGTPPPGLAGLIKKLHKNSPDAANALFLLALNLYPQYSMVDMAQYAELGTYLFTAPRSDPKNYDEITFTAIPAAGAVLPNLTKTRPDARPNLIEAYIRTAIALTLKPSADQQQAKLKYAIGYLMAPKAREISLNLSAELTGAMGTVQRSVPPDLANDAAFKYMDPPPPLPPEERFKEIDKNGDPTVREQLYLNMAANAWWAGDFELARTAADKLQDSPLKNEFLLIVTFGELDKLLRARPLDLDALDKKVYKMPDIMEKAMLNLGMAAAARDTGKTQLEKDFLENAERTCQKVDDPQIPFLLLAIAARSRELRLPYADATLSDAIKRLNRIDKPQEPRLQHSLGEPPTEYQFSIAVKGVEIGFASSFARTITGDGDGALAMANDLTDEGLRAKALIAVAKFVLGRKPDSSKTPKADATGKMN